MNRLQSRPKKTARKKILIVDDHPVLREGLTVAINQQPDLAVCAQAGDAEEAMAAVGASKPDAAIIDISLQGRSGVDLIKDLKNRHPDLPVMALSMHDEDVYAERALRAGALGYVMKKESTENMLKALRKVLDGKFHVSERMSARLLQLAVKQPGIPSSSPSDLLSDRELEVFELLGHGESTRQIAEALHLSIKTVSCYRENIKTKLNFKGSAELVSHAIHWVRATEQS